MAYRRKGPATPGGCWGLGVELMRGWKKKRKEREAGGVAKMGLCSRPLSLVGAEGIGAVNGAVRPPASGRGDMASGLLRRRGEEQWEGAR